MAQRFSFVAQSFSLWRRALALRGLRTRPLLRWVPVVAYIGLIYLTIPVAPTLWLRLGEIVDIDLDRLARIILLVAAAVASVPAVLRPRWRTFAAMALLAGVYVAIYRLPFETPAERVHLAEYGILPMLVAWALGDRRPLGARLVVGALVGGAVGIGDEIIQGLTPGRFGQVSDIALNAASAGLGALVCWVVAPARE